MNLQDDTIQLLVDLVEKEQRRLDQFQPDSQDYARRFHALMDRFTAVSYTHLSVHMDGRLL